MIKMDTAEGTRWIKITCKTAVHPIRCVVEDVTDEILETKALKVNVTGTDLRVLETGWHMNTCCSTRTAIRRRYREAVS